RAISQPSRVPWPAQLLDLMSQQSAQGDQPEARHDPVQLLVEQLRQRHRELTARGGDELGFVPGALPGTLGHGGPCRFWSPENPLGVMRPPPEISTAPGTWPQRGMEQHFRVALIRTALGAKP